MEVVEYCVMSNKYSTSQKKVPVPFPYNGRCPFKRPPFLLRCEAVFRVRAVFLQFY